MSSRGREGGWEAGREGLEGWGAGRSLWCQQAAVFGTEQPASGNLYQRSSGAAAVIDLQGGLLGWAYAVNTCSCLLAQC